MGKIEKLLLIAASSIVFLYASTYASYNLYIDPTVFPGGCLLTGDYEVKVENAGGGNGTIFFYNPLHAFYTGCPNKIDTDAAYTNHAFASSTYKGYLQGLSSIPTLPSGYMTGGYSSDTGLHNALYVPDTLVGVATVVNGKLKLGSYYFCLYDKDFPSSTTSGFAAGDYSSDPNYSCAGSVGGYPYINLNASNPTPTPPVSPIVRDINGLTCQTDNIPSFSGATWYNFGSLATEINADDPTVPDLGWFEVGTSGFDGDRDAIIWSPAGTGSLLGTGSYTYPGTSTGILLDPLNKFGILGIDSIRGGNKLPYNIFEFFGTENIAYGTSGAFSVIMSDGKKWDSVPMSSSGGVSVGTVANTNAYITTLAVQFLGRFNGLRLGRGPLVPKTSCSINFNICEWSYNGQSLQCQSAKSAGGLDFAGCGLTGSGSIYGSGACVPLADGSGMIIPPSPITGGYVTLDGSGNVVGTVAPVVPAESFFAGVFDCGIDTKIDAWYTVIGKSLLCPVVVFGNFSGKIWDSISGTQSRVNQLGQVSINALSGATMAGSGSSYTGGNLLIGAWLSKDAEIKTNKTIVITMASVLVVFVIFVIAIIVAIIKSK